MQNYSLLRQICKIPLPKDKIGKFKGAPTDRVYITLKGRRMATQGFRYGMLHEMCHLRHHNHSRAFYATLDRHMPNWKQIKAQLDGRAEEYLRF